MRVAVAVLQNAVRLIGVVLIVFGFLFWTGHSYSLVPLHMRLGETLVLLLWILAILGMRAKLSPALTISALVWGLLVVLFGYTMGRLLPGRAHELIRVLHFLIGLIAIGLSEMLGARIKRAIRPQVL